MNFKRKLNKLDYVSSKDEVVLVVADVLVEVASISKCFFDMNLSEILEDNIKKLRKRYPSGFDKEVADKRIDANKKYKEEEKFQVKKRKLTID